MKEFECAFSFAKNIIEQIWHHMDFDTFLIVTGRNSNVAADRTALKRRYKVALTSGLGNLSDRERKAIIMWAIDVVSQSQSPDLSKKEKTHD